MFRSPTSLAAISVVFAMAAVAAVRPAAADESTGVYDKSDWPLEATRRPLTLAPKMLEIRGDTLGISLHSGAAGEPIFAAPDLHFGFNHMLTVGIVHTTGFCLTGTDGGCPKGYDDIGVEFLYGLARAGNIQLAARGVVAIPSFDEFTAGLEAGLRLRIVGGKIAIVADPSIYIGLAGREPDGVATGPVAFSVPGNGPKETLHIPIDLQFQLNFQTMLFLHTGVEGALDSFGDNYALPIGLGILYALNSRFDVGAEMRMYYVKAKVDNEFDFRTFFLRAALRL